MFLILLNLNLIIKEISFEIFKLHFNLFFFTFIIQRNEMNKTGIIASNEKKSKKKLKLYNPQELEKDEQDVPYIATAFAEIIKYFIVYLLLLIFTFFSLIFFIINSILFYVLFFIMTV